MTRAPDYILVAEDVGRPWIKAPVGCCSTRTVLVSDFIGRILPQDVGKHCFWNNGILQVENNEQMAQRLERKGER